MKNISGSMYGLTSQRGMLLRLGYNHFGYAVQFDGNITVPKKVIQNSNVETRNGMELKLVFEPESSIPYEAEENIGIYGRENTDDTCFNPMDNHNVLRFSKCESLKIPGLSPLLQDIMQDRSRRIITTNGDGGFLVYSPIASGDTKGRLIRKGNSQALLRLIADEEKLERITNTSYLLDSDLMS